MALLRSVAARLPAIDSRPVGQIEQEILDELEFHVEMRTLDHLRTGLLPADARAAALVQFGDFQRIHQICRRTLLGERIVLQRVQIFLMIVVLLAVAWMAVQNYSSQRATEAAMVEIASALEQLRDSPMADLAEASMSKPYNWRSDRPIVAATFPENGATDVDPATAEVRVTFSKPMADQNWSWVKSSPKSFPQSTGEVHYLEDHRTCVMPVKLEAGTRYVIWFNTANYQNFKDTDGRPAEPYMLTFTTRE